MRNLVPKAKLQALRRQPAAPGEVYWLSGAVFAIDTVVFHRLGDFDPYTFLYYEEYILSARCKAQDIAAPIMSVTSTPQGPGPWIAP